MASLMNSAHRLLDFFMQIKKEENLWIISDLPSDEPGRVAIENARVDLGLTVKYIRIPRMRANGEEPPKALTDKIDTNGPIVAYTSYSLSSTDFRRKVCSNGGRFFSLPDGEAALELLSVEDTDLSIMRSRGLYIQEALEQEDSVKLLWNEYVLDIPLGKRKARLDLAMCNLTGSFGSPSFEVNTVPLEYCSEGTMFAIAAVPDLGVFATPVILSVEEGRIIDVVCDGQNNDVSRWAKFIREAHPDMLRIAELGIGLNHLLEFPADTYVANESVWGTVHVGIGRNLTLGGTFDAPGHIDVVLRPYSVHIGEHLLNTITRE